MSRLVKQKPKEFWKQSPLKKDSKSLKCLLTRYENIKLQLSKQNALILAKGKWIKEINGKCLPDTGRYIYEFIYPFEEEHMLIYA